MRLLTGAITSPTLAADIASTGIRPLRLQFRPDPHLWDGRFANNPWLQELPRPLTKLVWDNPLCLAPKTAKELGLANGSRVRATVAGRSVETAIWILPGQTPRTVLAPFGFGRRVAGAVGTGAGFDYFPLRGLAALDGAEVVLEKLDGAHPLATTEHHDALDADPTGIIKVASLADFHRQAPKPEPDSPSIQRRNRRAKARRARSPGASPSSTTSGGSASPAAAPSSRPCSS